MPMDWDLIDALIDLAKRECKVANDHGRREAAITGDRRNRMWIAEEDWIRVRPAIAVAASIIRRDGQVTTTESDALDEFVSLWLDQSEYGDCYRGPKMDAIAFLASGMGIDDEWVRVSARFCSEFMSDALKLRLADCIDELIEVGSAGDRIWAYELRELVLLGDD